jgi:DNA-binding GntR family transcriptional regulator
VDDELLIRRTSTADQVADAIRRRILRGDLTPGTPLREVALANSMGVSRNTVREGIRALVAEGLVRHSIHKGVFVARLTAEDVADIFRLRRVIETASVMQPSFPSDRLEDMERTVSDLALAIERDDVEAIGEADMRFHRQLVDGLESPRLSNVHAAALSELRLGLFLLDEDEPERPADWLAHHRQIVSLLRAGRRRDCAKVVRDHLAYTVDRLVRRSAELDAASTP